MQRDTGRALALIPVTAFAVLAALILPRAAEPDGVPLPELDERVIAGEIRADAERAERARRVPLSPEVRALGSAIRDFDTREAEDAPDLKMSDARAAIDRARRDLSGKGKDEELLALRAVQMEGFLAEVSRFEGTGVVSAELEALGGSFVRRMRRVGWCDGHQLVLTDPERRAAFKSTWNMLVELDRTPAFKLSTMETRALYTLYFTHPHAPEAQRSALALARSVAKDRETCDRIDDGERAGAQAWLMTKLGEYAAEDPGYPVLLARGIALYRRRQYGDSAAAFGKWLEAHPDGPWTLRARNYLRAATQAEEAMY